MPDIDPPRTGAEDPRFRRARAPRGEAALSSPTRRPGADLPEPDSPLRRRCGGSPMSKHLTRRAPAAGPSAAEPSYSAPQPSASACSSHRHQRPTATGAASPSASPAATGASTPATATTAGCSSARRPGSATAAASTPRGPTWPAARSRSPSRSASCDAGRRRVAHLRASPARGHDRRRGGRTRPGRARGLTIVGPRNLHGPGRRHPPKIASAQGVAGGWQRIWALNRDTVPNPNVIQVGQRLAI